MLLIWISLLLYFQKGKTQRKHTSHASNTHHTHQHKHAFISGKVYACAHCGRKDYLAKFYYAKLNMQNKNVWVRESTNLIGPKRFRYQRTHQIWLIQVCRPPPRLRGRWCLGGDASKLNKSIVTCIAIKKAPILEIARSLITSPLKYFLSS